MKEEIAKEILEQCSPQYLHIIDDSHSHKGHSGVSKHENTHFKVVIAADIFINKNKVKRHQYIYEICHPFFKQGLHALSLNTMTVSEWKQ
ncbi:hypothetical protein CL658_02370 [bacterium]|nr:hypothetical protein [bacterium]|tara:strand:- start:4835 stop:5104 length:270 start_codon:yes stop_codon:yes gene_type:complete